jgi:hypothetical protein
MINLLRISDGLNDQRELPDAILPMPNSSSRLYPARAIAGKFWRGRYVNMADIQRSSSQELATYLPLGSSFFPCTMGVALKCRTEKRCGNDRACE